MSSPVIDKSLTYCLCSVQKQKMKTIFLYLGLISVLNFNQLLWAALFSKSTGLKQRYFTSIGKNNAKKKHKWPRNSKSQVTANRLFLTSSYCLNEEMATRASVWKKWIETLSLCNYAQTKKNKFFWVYCVILYMQFTLLDFHHYDISLLNDIPSVLHQLP